MQRKIELAVGGLALFGLLAYTFVHTAGLLARWVDFEPVAWAAAFGVELSIVWMSIRIGANRKAGKQTKWLVFVLGVTLFISAVANVVEGFAANQAEQLTIASASAIDPIQAIVGVFATAFVCLVVFALSEVIGTDVDKAITQAKRGEQKAEPAANKGEQSPRTVKPTPEPTANSYQEQVYTLLASGEQMSQAEIARRTGASVTTVSKWAKAYQGERLRANGKGLEVVG